MPPPQDDLSPFPQTRWSLVDALRHPDSTARRRALETLLVRYLPALRAYLILERRIQPDKAADLLQSFIADKILERDIIARAEKSKGKLRTFLLTALHHFTIDAARKHTHSPDARQDLCLADEQPAPSTTFDREWASQVLSQTLARMEQNCRQWARNDLWEVFDARVLAPSLHNAPPTPYETLAPRFGLKSEQAANLLVTAKRLFARLLKEVISEYTDDPSDLEEELRDLRAALASSNARGQDLLALT